MNVRLGVVRCALVLAVLAASAGPGASPARTPVHTGRDATATTALARAPAPVPGDVVYQQGFASGARGWSAAPGTRLARARPGHLSSRALSLRTTSGAAAATVTVPARRLGAGRLTVGLWVRARRADPPPRVALTVLEGEAGTGAVLTRATRRLGVDRRWRLLQATVVRSATTSVLTIRVGTRQDSTDRVLVDDVVVTREVAEVPAGFPDAASTGVPRGVELTPYAGPMTITTPDTVIDAQRVEGSLRIQAPGVRITRSLVDGTIAVEQSGSLVVVRSTVDGGQSESSAIGQGSYTLKRVEVVGARASVGCDGDCRIQGSWLHAQYMPPGSDWHGDGFLSNGGSGMSLVGNTLACDSEPTGGGGACSAAVAAYGDFDPIRDLTVHGNLFVSSPAGYCLYGGYDPGKPYGSEASGVVITDNVFARGESGSCAEFGPVSAVPPPGSSNVFSGNIWVDGGRVRPD